MADEQSPQLPPEPQNPTEPTEGQNTDFGMPDGPMSSDEATTQPKFKPHPASAILAIASIPETSMNPQQQERDKKEMAERRRAPAETHAWSADPSRSSTTTTTTESVTTTTTMPPSAPRPPETPPATPTAPPTPIVPTPPTV